MMRIMTRMDKWVFSNPPIQSMSSTEEILPSTNAPRSWFGVKSWNWNLPFKSHWNTARSQSPSPERTNGLAFFELGIFPLVLDPVVAGSRLTRVLIDGGSGLNLLFASTIAKMGLDISDKLTSSKAPFYGIVLGNASTPIGTVLTIIKYQFCTVNSCINT